MPEDGERKGPIAFRMDKPDYKRFTEYVDSTDLSKSKVAERAALAYLDEQDEPTVPMYVSAGMLSTIISVGLFLWIAWLPPGAPPPWAILIPLVLVGYATLAFSSFFIKKLAE